MVEEEEEEEEESAAAAAAAAEGEEEEEEVIVDWEAHSHFRCCSSVLLLAIVRASRIR